MLLITITTKQGRQQLEHLAGPIEFGRGPQRDDVARVVVADDPRVSRDHLRMTEVAGGQLRIDNLSARNPVRLEDDTCIAPGEWANCELPVCLTIGETTVAVSHPEPDGVDKEALESLLGPVRPLDATSDSRGSFNFNDPPTPAELAGWFETLIAVQRAAAGSPEFYNQTAKAMVDLVGLDRGLVLLRQGGRWAVAAAAGRQDTPGRPFSYTVLEEVVEKGRTFFQSKPSASTSDSLEGVQAVVASPIFDAQNQVVGALYGARMRFSGGRAPGIGPLEAQVVQLLASVVGVGLARLEQEAAATQMRVQFEQFFTPYLAGELQRNPRLLEGQEREVTILFGDIRGFSRMAERISPHDTCRLVSAVMERLSLRIKDHDGVVVDYIGDGIMAMWNAPANQANHAALACRAALAMRQELPALSAEWQPLLGRPLDVGLGLNTGPALVGNIGSSFKFKYGALGHAVNLASRVEGATKSFHVPILITGSTQALLGNAFATRRLCQVRVVGVTQPVELYELHAEQATPAWLTGRNIYEQALGLFESGDWAGSCRALYPMLAALNGHDDIPALDLVARAVQCLKAPPERFDPVVELDRK